MEKAGATQGAPASRSTSGGVVEVMPTATMPAARAAMMPLIASSKTTQEAGGLFRRSDLVI